MDLASVILGDPNAGNETPQLRQGVVTQISPLLVRVGSATTAQPCNALGSYTPTVGDAVSVLVTDGDRLALGRANGRSLPCASATKSSTQAIANVTPTVVSFPDTEDFDTDGLHSTSVNPGRMTVPAGLAGMWSFAAHFYFPATPGAGVAEILLIKVGGARYGWTKAYFASGIDGALSCAADIPMAGGDYVECDTYQAMGASLTIGSATFVTRFTATYRGPL